MKGIVLGFAYATAASVGAFFCGREGKQAAVSAVSEVTRRGWR